MKAKTISDIRTVEGRVAQRYWETIQSIIPETFDFQSLMTRSHQYNASDPVNLCLNYAYACLKERDIKLGIPKQDKEIKLSKKFARSILPSTAMIAKAQDTYGFRLQKQFQALLQASALDHNRKSVNKSDVDRVLHLMNWINFDEKPIA